MDLASARRGVVIMGLGLVLVLVLTTVASGCDPEAPTRAQAEGWARADVGRVDAFAARVLARIEADQLLVNVPENDPRYFERATEREHARSLFRTMTFPSLVREAGFGEGRLLGARVRLLAAPDDEEVLGEAGTPDPPLRAGVRAADGAELDGKKLGYGVYGINRDGGVKDEVGFELEWTSAIAGRNVKLTFFLSGT